MVVVVALVRESACVLFVVGEEVLRIESRGKEGVSRCGSLYVAERFVARALRRLLNDGTEALIFALPCFCPGERDRLGTFWKRKLRAPAA